MTARSIVRSCSLVSGLASLAWLAGCGLGVPLGSEAEAFTATAGSFQLVRKDTGGKCLDLDGAGTANGTQLQQYSCNHTSAQEFLVEKQSDGSYRLANPSSGKCVDVNGTANGSQVRLYTCSSTSRQKLKQVAAADGYVRLQLAGTSRCLHVTGAATDDGADVNLYDCADWASESWRLEPFSAGGSSGSGAGGSSGSGAGGSSGTWLKANLTNFTSYPEPGSDECENYNGCTWAGQFAFVDGKQSESWVKAHNILAVHSKDAGKYALKTLRLRQGSKTIDATVYDECSDSDCSGCCTQNASQNGLDFLIDIEKYTMQRFGSGDGIVEFQCLDCN